MRHIKQKMEKKNQENATQSEIGLEVKTKQTNKKSRK